MGIRGFRAAFVLGLIFLLGACQPLLRKYGTDTGNPLVPVDNGSTPQIGGTIGVDLNSQVSAEESARALVSEICKAMMPCQPTMTLANCSSSVAKEPGLAGALGYSGHSTIAEVQSDSSRTTTKDALNVCLAELGTVSCSAPSSTDSTNATVTNSDDTVAAGAVASVPGSVGTGGAPGTPNSKATLVDLLSKAPSCAGVGH